MLEINITKENDIIDQLQSLLYSDTTAHVVAVSELNPDFTEI